MGNTYANVYSSWCNLIYLNLELIHLEIYDEIYEFF